MFNFIDSGFTHSKLKAVDGKHFYETPKGSLYPSVTTMLKATEDPEKTKSLQEWKDSKPEANYIMREAQLIGTQSHRLIENYLQDMVSPRSEFRLLSMAHFQNLKPLLDKNVDNIHGIELKMWSDKLKLGGMADLVAEYDGRLSIIDYKTKRSNQKKEWLFDYFLQATAYSLMFDELTGKPVKQLVILVSSEKDQVKPFVEYTGDYLNALTERLDRFYNT
jgi:genome maintenance exonuclease 1